MTTEFVNYYTDYINGSDVSGDGSLGNPWATVQHAANTIVRNTTAGDAINLLENETLSASLDLSGYGVPTYNARFCIRGADGNTATINGGGNAIIPGSANINAYTVFESLSFINYGTGAAIDASGTSAITVIGCSFYGGSNGLSALGNRSVVNHCAFEDLTGTAIWASGTGIILYIFNSTFFNVASGVRGYRNTTIIDGCIFHQRSGETNNELVYFDFADGVNNRFVRNSSFYGQGGFGCHGVSFRSIQITDSIVENCIFVGFSGTNARGIYITSTGNAVSIGKNGFYNNTINITDNPASVYSEYGRSDVQFSADPFVDAANGDFSLTAEAIATAFPSNMPSAGTINTAQLRNLGAVQSSLAGGGRGYPRASIFGR